MQLKEAQISELNGENDKRAKMSEAVSTMNPRDIESEVITTVGQPPEVRIQICFYEYKNDKALKFSYWQAFLWEWYFSRHYVEYKFFA